MAHTHHELKAKTVAELRDIASGIQHEAVQGYTQLNKEHLLVAICKALGIDTHEHRRAVGREKSQIKAKIHQLKKTRDEVEAAHDPKKLKRIRRQIHSLKRRLHKSSVLADAAAAAEAGGHA